MDNKAQILERQRQLLEDRRLQEQARKNLELRERREANLRAALKKN